jgi:hypothetical protein
MTEPFPDPKLDLLSASIASFKKNCCLKTITWLTPLVCFQMFPNFWGVMDTVLFCSRRASK